MSYDNVRLWFAKNDSSIITIDEINDNNKNKEYSCPICGSEVTPKATKSTRITPHFAHIDASKCDSEAMIHWWFKNKFIDIGDTFFIVSDVETKFVCKEVIIEKSYSVSEQMYRPDMTVLTECGQTIYFEVANKNKKKIEEYLDIWLELKKTVVEIDIKDLISNNTKNKFEAIFYNGKCFKTKRNDFYYNTIGKHKEELFSGKINKEIKERVKKLDWFWKDVFKYKNGEVDIEYMTQLIDSNHKSEKYIILQILSKQNCVELINHYIDYKSKSLYKGVNDYIRSNYPEERIVIKLFDPHEVDINNKKFKTQDLVIKSKHINNGYSNSLVYRVDLYDLKCIISEFESYMEVFKEKNKIEKYNLDKIKLFEEYFNKYKAGRCSIEDVFVILKSMNSKYDTVQKNVLQTFYNKNNVNKSYINQIRVYVIQNIKSYIYTELKKYFISMRYDYGTLKLTDKNICVCYKKNNERETIDIYEYYSDYFLYDSFKYDFKEENILNYYKLFLDKHHTNKKY